MMFQDNPFGSLPQFGGQQWQPPMAGGGFAGPEGLEGMMGGGMFGAPGKKKKGGFDPMMLSPLLAMFTSGHPNIGLGMISPGLGLARALGAFK